MKLDDFFQYWDEADPKGILRASFEGIDGRERVPKSAEERKMEIASARQNVEETIYKRMSEVSAMSWIGVELTQTPDGTPFPVMVGVNQSQSHTLPKGVERIRENGALYNQALLYAYKKKVRIVVMNEMGTFAYAVNFRETLADLLARAVVREMDELLMTGSGIDEPLGLIEGLLEFSTGPGLPSLEDYFEASVSLDAEMYQEDGLQGDGNSEVCWVMHPNEYSRLAKGLIDLTETATQQTKLLDLEARTLAGYPIKFSPHLSVATEVTGTKFAMFGNFGRAYKTRIVNRKGVPTTSRRDLVEMVPPVEARAEYTISCWFDGRVIDPAAARVLVVG